MASITKAFPNPADHVSGAFLFQRVPPPPIPSICALEAAWLGEHDKHILKRHEASPHYPLVLLESRNLSTSRFTLTVADNINKSPKAVTATSFPQTLR
jgi:hypothetical protein